MKTRYQVTLNGDLLSAIDKNIYIIDVQESAPKEDIALHYNPVLGGSRVAKKSREYLKISVAFEIHAADILERKTVCQKVAKWAMNGGWLELNDRKDQRLNVICTKAPVVESALKWTDKVYVDFTAYSCPYWQSKATAQTKDSCIANVNKAIVVKNLGNYKEIYSIKITNKSSETINNIRIRVDTADVEFVSVELSAGKSITIGYDDNMIMTITGKAGLLSKRTAESSDDLIADSSSQRTVNVKADKNADVVVTARGLFY